MSEAVGRQRFGRPVRSRINRKLTSTARKIERVFAIDPVDGKRTGRCEPSRLALLLEEGVLRLDTDKVREEVRAGAVVPRRARRRACEPAELETL